MLFKNKFKKVLNYLNRQIKYNKKLLLPKIVHFISQLLKLLRKIKLQ